LIEKRQLCPASLPNNEVTPNHATLHVYSVHACCCFASLLVIVVFVISDLGLCHF